LEQALGQTARRGGKRGRTSGAAQKALMQNYRAQFQPVDHENPIPDLPHHAPVDPVVPVEPTSGFHWTRPVHPDFVPDPIVSTSQGHDNTGWTTEALQQYYQSMESGYDDHPGASAHPTDGQQHSGVTTGGS
jgi:hypothetical protein